MKLPDAQTISPYRLHVKRVGDAELVRILQRLAAQRAANHARAVEAIAELRSRPCMAAEEPAAEAMSHLTADDVVVSEVAAALGWTPGQARQDVAAAVALDERMVATMNLLQSGEIEWSKVQVIVKQAVPLGDHTFAEARKAGSSPREAEEAARAILARLERMVLPTASKLTRGRLERRVEEAIARLDPPWAEERRRRSARNRSVAAPAKASADPEGQGMSDLFAHLPAPEAQAIWNTVDAYARVLRTAGDERTLEELRADTLTHLILRGHPPGDIQVAGPEEQSTEAGLTDECAATEPAPAAAGMDWTKASGFDAYGLRANVEVVVSLETLLGVSDAPAELVGHGPITASVARDIAFKAGSTWRRLVVDKVGRLVDYGREKYIPPEPLKQYIRGRDRSCRTPWCDRPAGTCDVDHVKPYPAGPTAAGNLQCKCRRCHRLKHEGHWAHETLGDGTIRMVSPAGIEYFSEPVDLRPVSLPQPEPVLVPDRGEPPF
jgi:uncharacterized protein DUF222